jgi:hypothetical protein
MGFFDELDINEKEFEEAKDSTLGGDFEALESGVYDATVEEVILFKDKFKVKDEEVTTTNLRINIKLKNSGKIISFKKDVGKTVKDGSLNKGFLARLKSLGLATNFDIDNLEKGKKVKLKSNFNKDCEGILLMGVNGKPVQAMVRKDIDTNKEPGEAFRESNSLEGVTSKGSEDVEKFNDKIAKNGGEFKYKGWVKTEKAQGGKSAEENKKDLDDLDDF